MIIPKMGIAIGVPTNRKTAPIDWAFALGSQNYPTGLGHAFIRMGDANAGNTVSVADARNTIAKLAIAQNAPFIWFVDDDTVPNDSWAAWHLLQTLNASPKDVMVAAGIYTARRTPSEPLVYCGQDLGPFWRWKVNGPAFECTGIGTGCMMIRSEVFKHLPEPWFKTVNNKEQAISDDLWFCDLVTTAGFKIMADPRVICNHWDVDTGTCFSLAEDSYPMLPLGKENILRNLPKGWMSMPELDWLTDQASRSRTIVELGSYMGRSTVAMARSTTGTVYSIDAFKATLHGSDGTEYATEPDLFEKFKKNVSQCENIKFMKMDHAECAKIRWPEEKADMVFIDGGHDYEDAKRDIEIWKSRVASGGLLCGHDINWPGVNRAVDELLPGWKPQAGSLWSYQVA